MKRLFFILIILFTFAPKVFAASVDMVSKSKVSIGDTISLNINADTNGQAINSVNMVLNYRKDLMTFSGYKKDGTIINLWIESPHEENGKIYMSGIIPGGVSGLYDVQKSNLSSLPLVQLLFTAKNPGTADFSFDKTDLLKNDGKGTELIHDEHNTTVTIETNRTLSDVKNDIDTVPPEPFDIIFIKSSFFSRTPSMIAFNTTDVDSGIKEYKMKIGYSDWKVVQNPQSLNKSIFPQNITIRAYDYAGNFQEAYITIPSTMSYYTLLIVLLFIICGIFIYKLLKYQI